MPFHSNRINSIDIFIYMETLLDIFARLNVIKYWFFLSILPNLFVCVCERVFCVVEDSTETTFICGH